MDRLKKLLLAACGVVILSFTVVFLGGHSAAHAVAPTLVTVYNPPSVPVPVYQKGAVTVNLNPVSNTVRLDPTGNAVSVSNTPHVTLDASGNTVKLDPTNNQVNVANSPQVGLNPASNTVKLDPTGNTVQVASSASSPLYVQQSADVAPSQPVQAELFSGSTYTVPNGKRLVIEYVSGAGNNCVNGSDPASVSTTLNGVTATFSFPLNGTGAMAGLQAVRLYADQNTTVSGAVSTAACQNGYVTISGYLINVS